MPRPHVSGCIYLVYIPIRATANPLDELEILLRIPPGQVAACAHCARPGGPRTPLTVTGWLRAAALRSQLEQQLGLASEPSNTRRRRYVQEPGEFKQIPQHGFRTGPVRRRSAGAEARARGGERGRREEGSG